MVLEVPVWGERSLWRVGLLQEGRGRQVMERGELVGGPGCPRAGGGCCAGWGDRGLSWHRGYPG